MRIIIVTYTLLLCSYFGYSQKIDIGFKFKYSFEKTKYANSQIVGSKSHNKYTLTDSTFRTFGGLGFTVKRILPKNFVLDSDLTFEMVSSNKKFRFKEYSGLGINYSAWGIGTEFVLSKRFPITKLPKVRCHLRAGVLNRLMLKDSISYTNGGFNTLTDFDNSIMHKGTFLANYFKLAGSVSYGEHIDLIIGLSTGITKKQNIVLKRELYFDFGIRVNLGMATQLDKHKIYNPENQ